RANWKQTGAQGFCIDVNRTGAALRDPAAKLRSSQPENVAQNPQQRHVVRRAYIDGLVVDTQSSGLAHIRLWQTQAVDFARVARAPTKRFVFTDRNLDETAQTNAPLRALRAHQRFNWRADGS